MIKDLAAALQFFTRLPFYKIKAFQVPSKHFKQAINYWSVIGWLTGGVMAAVLYLSSLIFPYSIAIVIAIISRLFLTGALHEDGLSDTFDGLGGGTTRERSLAIMKDSHIGTYGVLSLILYFFLAYLCLESFTPLTGVLIVFFADPLAKLIASHINKLLPYARNEETSKAKLVYEKMSWQTAILAYTAGLLPFLLIVEVSLWWIAFVPILVFLLFVWLLKRRIQGYVGDSCGAIFLLCELSLYLALVVALD